MKKAYHEWRAPLPVNSNWWLAFLNDLNVPEEVRRVPPGPGPITLPGASLSDVGKDWAGVTPWQVRRAAWLIWRILDFKDKLLDP